MPETPDPATAERRELARLLRLLCRQPIRTFPQLREKLDAPATQGVYIVRNAEGRIVHVGRSVRGKEGIYQRLKDHLVGRSSFMYYHLNRDHSKLRAGYTYQYLEVPDSRTRALLEALAVGWLCPVHIGLGDGE